MGRLSTVHYFSPSYALRDILPGVFILLHLSLQLETDTGAMRLLYFDSSKRLTSTDFSGKTVPPYAILSHTWEDEEFLFEDLVNGTGKDRKSVV